MPRFRRTKTDSRELESIQNSIEESLNPLCASPLAGARIVDATLAVGANKIAHGLDRAYQGFLIVKNSSVVNVHDGVANDTKDRFIVLTSDAAASIRLLVF